MRPDVGSIRRLTIFKVVVLPHPDGPTRTHTWPAGMASESARTASWPLAYCLLIASRRIIASVEGDAEEPCPDGRDGGTESTVGGVIGRRYPSRSTVRLGR